MDSVKCEVTKLVIPTYPKPKAEDLPKPACISAQAETGILIRWY